MLAAVSMCIQFRSYLRGAKFTLCTDHKYLVWLYRFKDTEGMMARWLHTLQQFQFSIIHRACRDHSNANGLSRAPTSPGRQCTRPDFPTVNTTVEVSEQPFDAESLGDSEDADLVPMQSGEDWVAQLDDDLSRPASRTGKLFRITALQLADTTCVTLLEWIQSDTFPIWVEVKSLCPELRFCGTTGIICQRTQTEWCGGRGAPIVFKFNYWYRRQEDRNYFWLITLQRLGVIWAGTERWPA